MYLTGYLPITWGIILGLSPGKPVGVLLATWILLKFFYKNMPRTREIWKLLPGNALLCGIGFNMSLFIVNLSFGDEILREEARMGILIASIIRGLLGYFALH